MTTCLCSLAAVVGTALLFIELFMSLRHIMADESILYLLANFVQQLALFTILQFIVAELAQACIQYHFEVLVKVVIELP